MEESKKKVHFAIGGMTCVNCQKKIKNELTRTAGIVSAGVSYNNGTADIVYEKDKISPKEIIGVIERLGYEVLPKGKQQNSGMMKNICILIVIAVLYFILQSMGILNLLAPSRLADTKMGYGMLFLIGLITSVHCIAMCGGINISQCIPQKGRKEGENSRESAFRPALAYNLGRVLSYTAVGFILGLIGLLFGGGTEIGLSAFLQGILKMAAGMFMVIMGINMLGLFPRLRKFTIRMPGFLARRVGKEKARAGRPFIVGILNGFMPCGPLQSMQIVALATGNPFAGALSMFLFSLGTVPLMLGLGSAVSALGKRFTDKVMTVGAVLVVVLGLAMLSQGGSLSGWIPSDLLMILVAAFCIAGVLLSIPVKKEYIKNMLEIAALVIVIGSYAVWSCRGMLVRDDLASETEAEVVEGVQVINSTLSARSYPSITVQAGVPVKWVIDAPEGSINGCNYKVIIRDYDIEYTFHSGENVIEFTPEETGTVRYSCWMGMIYGSIFVTDGTEAETAESNGEVSVPVPAGYEIPTDSIATAVLTADESGNAFQEVSVTLTDEGFSPAVIVVQSNVTAAWYIDNRMTAAGDGITLLAPYYSTQLLLGEGENQLILYPLESFDVSTGDNRFYCYVKVVDDISEVNEAAVREEAAAYVPMIYPAEVFESPGMSCCGY